MTEAVYNPEGYKVMNGSDFVQTSDIEIPIWIGGSTRWMQGLSQLTTCDDIIYSLLYSMANPMQGDPSNIVDDYGLFETYGDQERKLSSKTKILRLWNSWGDESQNVRFSLRKLVHSTEEELMTPLPSESDSGFGSTSGSFSHPPQRVCGRKEMRMKKLQKPVAATEVLPPPALVHIPPPCFDDTASSCPSRSSVSADPNNHTAAMQQLMSLILAQESRIQDIHKRIADIDSQIEHYEGNMHDVRVKSEGPNYLQNAYLEGTECDENNHTKLGTDLRGMSTDQLQSFVDTCENVLQLSGQLETQEGKIHDFSVQIESENLLESLIPSPIKNVTESAESNRKLEHKLECELDKTRREVQASRSLCSENSTQMNWINSYIKDCDDKIAEKQIIISMLLEHEHGIFETIVEADEDCDDTVTSTTPTSNNNKQTPSEKTDSVIMPEPICSSTPNSARTSPVLHQYPELPPRLCKTKPNRTGKLTTVTTAITSISANHQDYHNTSKSNHINAFNVSISDPSMTVLASNTSSMLGTLFTTDIGCKSPGSDTDTTSDTGLSSMHSTTSEEVAYTTLETLV